MTHGDCSALLSSLHSPDVISSFKDLTMTIRLPGLLKKLLLRRNITLARQVLPISISTEHPRLYIYRCLCVCDIYQINLSVYHSLTVTKRGNICVSMLDGNPVQPPSPATTQHRVNQPQTQTWLPWWPSHWWLVISSDLGGGSLQSRKISFWFLRNIWSLYGLILVDDRCHCNIFNDNNSQLKNISLAYSEIS